MVKLRLCVCAATLSLVANAEVACIVVAELQWIQRLWVQLVCAVSPSLPVPFLPSIFPFPFSFPRRSGSQIQRRGFRKLLPEYGAANY